MSDETPSAEASEAEQTPAEASESDEAAKPSVLDSLDLARGEIDDEDLEALEAAIDTLDFATRKATPERLARLDGLNARLADLIEQVKGGVRRSGPSREPLSEEQLERFHKLVDDGVSAGQQGDLEQAVRHLEEAVRLNPEGQDGLFNLGVVYGLLAHKNITTAEFYDDYVRDEVYVEKAQICYDQVLEQDPAHLPSLNNLATLYAMRDHRDEAAAVLQRIVTIDPKTDTERHIVKSARSQLAELESI